MTLYAEHLHNNQCYCQDCHKMVPVEIRSHRGEACYRLPPGWAVLDIDIESVAFVCPECQEKWTVAE